jgi:hypothetical protein
LAQCQFALFCEKIPKGQIKRMGMKKPAGLPLLARGQAMLDREGKGRRDAGKKNNRKRKSQLALNPRKVPIMEILIDSPPGLGKFRRRGPPGRTTKMDSKGGRRWREGRSENEGAKCNELKLTKGGRERLHNWLN